MDKAELEYVILELREKLKSCERTKFSKLSKVLPSRRMMEELKQLADKFLTLWDYYHSHQLTRKDWSEGKGR